MSPDRTKPAKAVQDIWERALNVPEVGPEDDFFALGGNSRVAIAIVSRVRDVLGVEVPVAVLSTASTFRDFAEVVHRTIQALEEPNRA